jgi:hypothetical protein
MNTISKAYPTVEQTMLKTVKRFATSKEALIWALKHCSSDPAWVVEIGIAAQVPDSYPTDVAILHSNFISYYEVTLTKSTTTKLSEANQ